MKRLTTETFMSWMNKDLDGQYIRAIALCDSDGYFNAAINCVRDSQMGDKDKCGIYPRVWYADYIKCYGDEYDIRPATLHEVDLYMERCDVLDEHLEPYCRVKKIFSDENGTHITFESRSVIETKLLLAIRETKERIRIWRFKISNLFRKHHD